MRREIESHSRQASETGIEYDDFLLDLTKLESEARAANRLKLHIREARFPQLKSLESFLLEAVPELDIRMFRELVRGEFIKERRNVIFLGNSETGKTHMAITLGLEACKSNYKTRFVTCYGMTNELIEVREERALQRMLKRYRSYDLLILDELGYIPFSREGAELLFQVLAERHEKGSVMITTNLGFANWTLVFGDERRLPHYLINSPIKQQ